MSGNVAPRLVLAAWCIAASLVCACAPAPRASDADRSAPDLSAAGALVPVSLPDLKDAEEPVRHQLRDALARVQSLQANGAPSTQLAEAFGGLGKLLMAAGEFEFAEPCLINARSLDGRSQAWPYYLGHVYKARGAVGDAVRAFERALALKPDDVPTLVWIAELRLLQGHPADAVPLFVRARDRDPGSVAAVFGLGRAALAQRDYPTAVAQLEETLSLEPKATSVHQPLAAAYRGLGNSDKAEAHARQMGDFEIAPADPLMDQLKGTLRSAIAYEIAGTRALNEGDWQGALAAFRQGLKLEPSSPSLGHKLGTALYASGDASAAKKAFEEVVADSPQYAKAHYSLGLLLASEGRSQEAIARLSGAIATDPSYVEAYVGLAEILRKGGRLREAVAQYNRALALDPRLSGAALGRAVTLIRLRQYREALGRLRESRQAHPEDPWLVIATARLLAAAPDDGLRDGARALELMESLSAQDQRLDLGETMAMSLAEVGRFQEALTWQRGAIEATARAGQTAAARPMAERLRLYTEGKANRTPWGPDELQ